MMTMPSPAKRKPRVAVVGSLVFDCVAQADRLPRKGETVLGRSFGMFSGGKGANQAVAAARLGAEVFMIGRVGDDALAEHVLASLRSSGVDTRFIKKDASVCTGACCIHVDAAGDNAIIIVPEGNMACTPEDVDAAGEVLASADVLVCQLEIALPAVVRAVDLAAKVGVRIVLNPAPAGPVPEGLFAKATFLTPNETEGEFFSGVPLPAGTAAQQEGDWEARASARLLGMGPQAVVITLGHRGAYLAMREKRRLISSFPVTAVDATAAGDAFNGALAVALAEGVELEPAIVFANAAGALAATRAGAQPSLPTRSEVDEFLLKMSDHARPGADAAGRRD
jgi:ribokinase